MLWLSDSEQYTQKNSHVSRWVHCQHQNDLVKRKMVFCKNGVLCLLFDITKYISHNNGSKMTMSLVLAGFSYISIEAFHDNPSFTLPTLTLKYIKMGCNLNLHWLLLIYLMTLYLSILHNTVHIFMQGIH